MRQLLNLSPDILPCSSKYDNQTGNSGRPDGHRPRTKTKKSGEHKRIQSFFGEKQMYRAGKMLNPRQNIK